MSILRDKIFAWFSQKAGEIVVTETVLQFPDLKRSSRENSAYSSFWLLHQGHDRGEGSAPDREHQRPATGQP